MCLSFFWAFLRVLGDLFDLWYPQLQRTTNIPKQKPTSWANDSCHIFEEITWWVRLVLACKKYFTCFFRFRSDFIRVLIEKVATPRKLFIFGSTEAHEMQDESLSRCCYRTVSIEALDIFPSHVRIRKKKLLSKPKMDSSLQHTSLLHFKRWEPTSVGLCQTCHLSWACFSAKTISWKYLKHIPRSQEGLHPPLLPTNHIDLWHSGNMGAPRKSLVEKVPAAIRSYRLLPGFIGRLFHRVSLCAVP